MATANQKTFLHKKTLMINIISPTKFKVKGPEKLHTIKMNHHDPNIGEITKLPLFNISLRECLRSYLIFAHANIPEEQSPCATIITIAPFTPQLRCLITPTNTRDI
jgi:hypothetical protein